MRVKLRNFKQYDIALKNPFKVGDKTISHSRSFQYECTIEDKTYIGEIPSLELFYPDQKVEDFKDIELEINLSALNYAHKFFAQKVQFQAPANNLIFSIEQLLLNYINDKNIPMPLSFSKNYCQVNGLDTGTPPDQNYQVVKLKIGRSSLREERETIKAYIQKGISLRLDGNRMCSVPYVEELLSGLDLSTIEYLEEPFSRIDEWEEFKLIDQVCLAVDESLNSCLECNHFPTNTSSLIVKPSLTQSISGIEAAKKNGLINKYNIVISSSFEAPQSFNTLIAMASDIKGFHGLSTMEHLNLPQNMFKTKGDIIHGLPLASFQL